MTKTRTKHLALLSQLVLGLLLTIAAASPSSGMDPRTAVEVYLRLAAPPTSVGANELNQCQKLLVLLGPVAEPKCRAVNFRQGILALRWSEAMPDQVLAQLQELKHQGLVQWFEIKQEELKLQTINHGEATVVADSAFWSELKPSEPERDDPWFVSDDLRRLRAWNLMLEVQGQVVIAVIDSGNNFLEPGLAAMRWHNPSEQGGNGLDDDGNGYVDDTSGWDFVNEGYAQLFDDTNAPDNDPTDMLGHGTAVAQVIRAVVGSELSERVRLMPLRVAFGLNGSGTVNPAALAEAIYYAADNGAHIINISLGGAQRYEVVAAAIQYAQGKGVALVVAAGNSGGAPLFPASEAGVLSVGALDRNNAVLTSSARGAGVDIFASGVDMFTSTNASGMTFQPSGTSFAAPVVSATLALLQAIHLGAATSCHEQRQSVLNQLPPGGHLPDWIAFQLQRSEKARQSANTSDAWQQAMQTCGAPAATLSSLVRNL